MCWGRCRSRGARRAESKGAALLLDASLLDGGVDEKRVVVTDVGKCHHANGLDKTRLDEVDGILVVLRMLGACAYSWKGRVGGLDSSGAGREQVVIREELGGMAIKRGKKGGDQS